MKILYLLDRHPQSSLTFVTLEMEGLRHRGHAVDSCTLLPGEGDAEYTARDVAFGRLLRGHLFFVIHHPLRYWAFVRLILTSRGEGWQMLLRAPWIGKLFLDGGYDHLRVHFGWTAALVSRAVQSLTRAPRSVTLHALDIYLSPKNLKSKCKDCSVVTISRFNVEYLERRHSISSEHIPCGVEIAPPRNVEIEGPPSLLSIGRLVEKKGFDILLQAFAQVRIVFPSARLILVGDGPLRNELHYYAQTLGLGTSVTFLGATSHQETLAHFDRAHVFALACCVARNGDVDGQPVVLKEAMMRGVPIVAASVTGVPELIDSSTGWLVPPDDPQILASAICTALAKPDVAQGRAARARARVMASETIDHQVAALERVIAESLVAHGRH